MASLTNTKIKDTYDGLLKTTDNAALGGTYKVITDGLGNSSGVYLGTGGRLGIGASSPTTPLEVVSSDNTLLYLNSSTANVYLRLDDLNSTNGNFIGATTDDMHFWTNNTERMRIKSDGNIGIGTTDPQKKLVISETTNATIRINSTKNGSWTAEEGLGHLEFFGNDTSGEGAAVKAKISATSKDTFGTAFNMTFGTTNGTSGISERMRIRYDGFVGIGETSPDRILHLKSSVPAIRLEDSDVSGLYHEFLATAAGEFQFKADGGNVQSNSSFAFTIDGSEKMRIDSSGNVGIGRTPTSHILEINGEMKIVGLGVSEGIDAYNDASRQWGIKSTSAGTDSGMKFEVQDSERMRITSGGRIHFYNLLGSSATQSDVRYDTTSKELFYNTSSERYKTEIVDLENTLDKVNSLRAVRYKDIETEQETTGLIAEEVIEIIPEVVFKKEIEGFDEPQPEGINYSDFAPFLIKAIQELKAEIETLKSQINS